MQYWRVVQQELMPELRNEIGEMTPRLEKLIHTLEWVRIDEFVRTTWRGRGRPPHDRISLASAFVAKAVLGLGTTVALIERLTMDRALRRICGFSMWRRLPSEATFSRAFEEFAEDWLAERTHEGLVSEMLGASLIGHISRDGTAIEAREQPARQTRDACDTRETKNDGVTQAESDVAQPKSPAKGLRGRPRKGDERPPKMTKIQRQKEQTLKEIMAELPQACGRGTKCNAQGYKNSWNGYKLHMDTADCGVIVSALLTSASVHDSQAAIPLSILTGKRVTNCYDLMDAAYCSEELRAYSRSLGHVPLIDHNPRKGVKIEFAPHEAARYKERSQAERSNARLKDEFGGRDVWVRGPQKVMSHLMFGVLALTADQLMRLLL